MTDDNDVIKKVSLKCSNAIKTGLEILVDLDIQLENLDNIELRLDYINMRLSMAEEELDSMEKCCGLFPTPAQIRRKQELKRSESDELLWKVMPEEMELMLQGPPLYLERYKKAKDKKKKDKKKDGSESDTAIIKLMHDLTILRSMAIDIVNELTQQNEQIPHIMKKTIKVHEKVAENNERSLQLLGSKDTPNPIKLSPI